MKKILLSLSLLLFIISACDNDEEIIPDTPAIDTAVEFLNPFSSEYLISEEIESSLAERFVWKEIYLGESMNVSYEFQGSTDQTFATFDIIETTSDTHTGITVRHLLDYAEALGLDNDPTTTDGAGDANNTGAAYFRVRAFAVSSAGVSEIFSSIQEISFQWPESRDIDTSIGFSNSFANEYLISTNIESNLAERFVWGGVYLGEDISVSYELQGSTDQTFASFDVVTTTSDTHMGITVKHLLDYAVALGLDSDPTTTTNDGDPNNAGKAYFRVKAFDQSGTSSTELLSDVQEISFKWLESEPEGCSPIWGVGAGLADAGWDWSSPAVFNCDENIYTAKVKLVNDAFRFFETEGDWNSGLNYPYFVGEGYTIDPLFEDAQDGDQNFRFLGDPGVYTLTVDMVNKTITVNADTYYLVGAATPGGWDWAGPTSLIETEIGIRKATLNLTNEAFSVFTTRDDWGSGLNFPYFVGEGYTIDANFEDAQDGDNNFRFIGAPGEYTFILNDNDKTITLE